LPGGSHRVGHVREHLSNLIDAYRAAGGRGRLHLQVHLSWAPDEAQAEAIAHEQWRSNVFPPPACWDIDSAETFDAVSQDVSIEPVRQVANASSGLGRHTAQLAEYAELGFDEIALHHVGQRQDEWIEIFGAKGPTAAAAGLDREHALRLASEREGVGV